MRLFLMHMDNDRTALDPREEVALIVPGGEKTVLIGPISALPAALPGFAAEFAHVDQACPCCGEDLAALPNRVVR
jgi:hypothetical protein